MAPIESCDRAKAGLAEKCEEPSLNFNIAIRSLHFLSVILSRLLPVDHTYCRRILLLINEMRNRFSTETA